MQIDKGLHELIDKAKACLSDETVDRQHVRDFLSNIDNVINTAFANNDQIIEDDEFEENLIYQEYIIYSLRIVTKKNRFTFKEIVHLFQSTITAICSNEDDELAGNFHGILAVLVDSSAMLEEDEYEAVLLNLLDVVKYCDQEASSSTVYPKFIETKTISKIEENRKRFFKIHISQNIFTSLFRERCKENVCSNVLLQFWPYSLSNLKEAHTENDAWIVENCLRVGLHTLKIKRKHESILDQAQCISELFTSFSSSSKFKNHLLEVLTELFSEIRSFMNDNEILLAQHKELQDIMLGWLKIYIDLIENTTDAFGLLDRFTLWLVDLTGVQEIHELSAKICVAPIESCVNRIKLAIHNMEIDCLSNYLDILASLFKIARVQKTDSFQWFIAEVQRHVSLDNPRWPRLLSSLLGVQHPVCQSFCKQFAPSTESLWMKLKNSESSRNTVISLAIVIGSCSFLNNNDERVKQVLSFLSLPCFQTIRERVGGHWDNFRLYTGQNSSIPDSFRGLERYTSALESNNSEATQIRAVHCALQMERTTGKCINFVVDMSLAVLSKSQTDRIAQCLPATVIFLSENLQFINDFVSLLITKLCEKHSTYSENTILEFCKTLQKLICISSNGKNICRKCTRNGFVEPDKNEHLKIDDRSLVLAIKGITENRKNYSESTIREFLQTCRVILLHVESKKRTPAFIPVIKSLDLAFSENADSYFRLWELMTWKNGTNLEKKLLIYVPLFTRTFASPKIVSIESLNNFTENVVKAKLPTDVKATVFASIFSHAVIVHSKGSWNIILNWIHKFASSIITDLIDPTEEELLQVMFKRYATIFTRSFIFRLFYETTTTENGNDSSDEIKMREAARFFISQVFIVFKYPNSITTINIIRPTLLYWTLVFGSRGTIKKYSCWIIDFMCQELNNASTSTFVIPKNSSNIHLLLNQRKALINEFFPQLVQLSTFEVNKKADSIWTFCEAFCKFTLEDMKAATCSYRKEVFEQLLLVASQDFVNTQESSPIVVQLQKAYESMKKGEKFEIGTAMETKRNEGIEFIFSFRTYFTNDSYFLLRHSAATSFHTVLQSLRPEFFGENWWAILMALRQSPAHLEATKLSWIVFIDKLSYATLRNHIWRILTDLSRIPNNTEIIEHLWNRLNYASEIAKNAIDDMVKVYWFVPLELEKKIDLKLIIAKSRRIEDVYEFIRDFSHYPTLQFLDNLSSKMNRGTIPKEDIPKLMGALSGILPICQSRRQRMELIEILQKVPITHSQFADHDFVRWDKTFKFFSEPRQLTQRVLEECVEVIENMTSTSKIEFADRTMCEIYKFFNEMNVSEVMKSTLKGLSNMYSKMVFSRKPDPMMIEQKTIDELSQGKNRPKSFARWLTVLILKCAEMAEDAPLASLAWIAHIDDTTFLAKLSIRFILTVLQMERDSVSQWILSTFEEALANACQRRLRNSDRGPAVFIFYVFDFLYFYINSEELRKNKEIKEKVVDFWKDMAKWIVTDNHGHEQPLIVRVAEMFGMEKRCIFWLEMIIELKKLEQRKGSGSFDSPSENKPGAESAYYFTLMNLYARIHELNGVRGAYAMLSKTQIDHVYGKICIREAFGELNSAASLAEMTGKGKPFNATEEIKKLIEEQNSLEYSPQEKEEQDEYVKSLKTLSQWVHAGNDVGPSPHVFSRTIESRSTEAVILMMIQNQEDDDVIDNTIDDAKMKIIDKLSECSLGGSCSYETATPFIVELQKLDEITELKNASKDTLVKSDFWTRLNKRTSDGEQSMSVLEPILRVRRSMLDIRMKSLAEYKDKDEIKSRIVDAHLQSARIARLTGCLERAQLSIINAKKVLPFENKIVLEEAKLRLQTSEELNGMSLLDSIIAKNFGEIQTTYSHTQQSTNLDVQKSARLKIEMFPPETKNLFSSVQMLRISHMIKSGNTVGFEKLFDETKQLIELFASSGVMYEAVWFMDYLSNYNERSKPALSLLKAYREIAKHERDPVLQARAVERMTSLWLCNTRKINELIMNTKMSEGQITEMKQNIRTMNREMEHAWEYVGWRAFYPAYAVLARHIDHQQGDVARSIKAIMKQLIYRMPHQCMWQSVYLLRQNLADIREKYMDVLTEVKRKSACYVTLIDQYDYASGIFNSISTKIDSDDCKLSEKVEGLKYLFRDKKYDPRELEMNRRLDGDCKVLNGIMIPIRSVIDESIHDLEISNDGYEVSCHLPDRYLIHDFSESVKVLHSNTKPVLIELTTLTGRKVRLICKKNDDLTKDYHFNKIVEMCNDLLMKDEQTKIQNMAATTFSVIPLAKQGGIIEFIEGVTPYFDTLDKLMQMKTNEWTLKLSKWKEDLSKLKSKDKRAEYFRDVACKSTPVVMSKWFRLQYPEAGKWFASRKQFAKSTAVMSIIGYIFGLGDRHTKNLMVHLPTGKCIHVDFDMIFNKGETLGIPELVPFRLTQNMINGMGEVALDGEFRSVCEQTLRVFRENSYEIEKYISDLPNLVADFANNKLAPKDFDMTEAKRLVSGRIRGQIMTVKLHKSRAITYPMQVSQLASSLIDLATSDEKLCDMFPGWMPTL